MCIDDDNSPAAWDKRQYVSDSSAERVARHRAVEKQVCNVTATPPDPEAEPDTETDFLSQSPDSKTPKGVEGGVLKNRNGEFNILGLLSEDGLASARRAAEGWDIYRLADIYNNGIGKRDGPPRSPDKAFAGWCAKYTKGKAPA